jgi:hypothetical protein
MNNDTGRTIHWFPGRRFDADFPLVLWFAGLWFYLKSFLYLCYVYMLGIEPPPYPLETFYFALGILPALLLGIALWNEKKWLLLPAIIFLGLDTPVLLLHIRRLSHAGFLDSGLTLVLEYGSLALNLLAFGWLIGYYTSIRAISSGQAVSSQGTTGSKKSR